MTDTSDSTATDATTTETTAITDTTAAATTDTTTTNEPAPITDEILFAELGKRYENIKGKEDLDRLTSFNEAEYVKPKSELVKKFNEWTGDPELFFKVSKLDVGALDNKSAIIQDMVIKEGLTHEIAEIKFNKRFGSAFEPETIKDEDNEDIPNPNFNKNEKLLAEHEFNKQALESKESLAKWKASSEEAGFKQPDQPNEAQRMQEFQDKWVKPVTEAVNNLQKISMETKYTLPDKTEVTETFNYGVENPETKKMVMDVLNSESSDVFMQKFMKEFGTDEKGNFSFSKMAESLAFLKDRKDFIGQAMAVAASKGVATHLESVRPGNLQKTSTAPPAATPQGEKALIEAWNQSYLERQKAK